MKFTKYLKEDTEDEGGKVSDSIIDFFPTSRVPSMMMIFISSLSQRE